MQLSRILLSTLSLMLVVPSVCLAWGDYLRDVKPLLAHKCYACHGALRQQGALRLDTAAALLKGGESGAAVIPGKPAESLLIEVLTGNAGFRMPPANEGTPLTEDEIELVRQWIKQGAPAPKDEQPQVDPKAWWSYQAIERLPLPDVENTSWCRNEVDRWVAAAREERRLPHAHETPKEIWLRRVFLDLIGLPPTRDELRRFLADESPTAYEDVVDELLARPQYGERWGRHWMDVWRYSDWYGSRGINEIRYSQRHIWRWRDWIIKSLNDDKGYDQMVREMLAADEIAGGDPDTLPATGYLGRNWYKFDRNVWMFDTVERTGEAFLGLTLRCCRCHDHKFDPITHEEYYRFRAFFEPHDVRTDPISALTKTQKDATLGQVLNDGIALVYDKHLDAKTFRFQRGDSRYPDETKPLVPGTPAALGGLIDVQPIELPVEAWYPMLRPSVRDTLVDQASSRVSEAISRLTKAKTEAEAAADKLAQSARSPSNTSSKIILEDDFSNVKSDLWQVVNGDWKHEGGRLLQSEVTSFATIVSQEDVTGDFKVHLRYRPLQPGTYRSVGFSFDYQDKGNSQDVYTSTGDSRQSVQAFHRLGGKQFYPQAGIVKTTLKVEEEATFEVSVIGSSLTIDLNGQRKLNYKMPERRRDGKFALWVHQGAAEFLELKITAHVDSRETLTRKKADADQTLAIAKAEVGVARAEVDSIEKRIAAEVARYSENESGDVKRLAMAASVAEQHARLRQAKADVAKANGSELKAADATKKLAAVVETAEHPTGEYTPLGEQFSKLSTGRRTALAKWITNRDNPRAARVAANHIWARHFAQPIVATPENFGLNGRKPTHPDLLDWLASELMNGDWTMKRLHKRLVLSATYRMSSSPRDVMTTPEIDPRAIDSENVFLWRMNSRRMEAEVVRDSTLSIASRLDLAFCGAELSETDGEKVLRRSLYFRNTPNEKMGMLEVFDVANPNGCYRRKESVVPHQSLAMMNSGLTLDAARTIAARLQSGDGFVVAAFESVLCRKPTEMEAARCEQFLIDHATSLQERTQPLFKAGGSATIPPSNDHEMRAKENLIHVLLLHNDFVTVR